MKKKDIATILGLGFIAFLLWYFYGGGKAKLQEMKVKKQNDSDVDSQTKTTKKTLVYTPSETVVQETPIMKLQKWLNRRGANLQVDGVYGARTGTALKKYCTAIKTGTIHTVSDLQRALNKLGAGLQVDGALGNKTWQAVQDKCLWSGSEGSW